MNYLERNAEMLILRVEDPHLNTYQALGERYGISRQAVEQTLKRITPDVSIIKAPLKIPKRMKCGNVGCLNDTVRTFCSRKCFQSNLRSRRLLGEMYSRGKRCARCKKDLPLGEFYKTKHRGVLRLHAYCKKCHGCVTMEWQKKNPEKTRESQKRASRKFYLAHREERIEEFKKKYRENKAFRESVKARYRAYYHKKKLLNG